jgi:hypothetical protein
LVLLQTNARDIELCAKEMRKEIKGSPKKWMKEEINDRKR